MEGAESCVEHASLCVCLFTLQAQTSLVLCGRSSDFFQRRCDVLVVLWITSSYFHNTCNNDGPYGGVLLPLLSVRPIFERKCGQ